LEGVAAGSDRGLRVTRNTRSDSAAPSLLFGVLMRRLCSAARAALIASAPGRPPLVGTAHCSGFRELGQQRGDLPVTPPGDVLVAQRRLRCRMTKAAHQFRECRTRRCGQDSAGMPKVVEA